MKINRTTDLKNLQQDQFLFKNGIKLTFIPVTLSFNCDMIRKFIYTYQ